MYIYNQMFELRTFEKLESVIWLKDRTLRSAKLKRFAEVYRIVVSFCLYLLHYSPY